MNFPRKIRFIAIAAAFLARHAVPADFDFAILGDRTGNAAPGVYEQITKEIGAHRPDFVINVGDSIEGMDHSSAVAEWAALRSVWKNFGDIPFYLVPGNHDIWSAESERIWRRESGHPPQYSFDFRSAHITVLDNSRSEGLAADQIAFLESDLAAHSGQQFKFIFFHRPFWLVAVKFQNGNFPLHRLAKKYGAGFVVSGHAHEFDRSEYDQVQYVMVGSSGGSLSHGTGDGPLRPKLDGLYFGYAWVHVSDTAARLDFRRVDAQSGRGK
jgi:predicted phosphodiesterase